MLGFPKAKEGIKGPLLAELTPEQNKDWEESKGFNVRGSNGEIYRILDHRDDGYHNNILGHSTKRGYDPELRLLGYFPIRPCRNGYVFVVGMDCFLMQKILLECDAPRVSSGACIIPSSPIEVDRMRKMGDYKGKI